MDLEYYKLLDKLRKHNRQLEFDDYIIKCKVRNHKLYGRCKISHFTSYESTTITCYFKDDKLSGSFQEQRKNCYDPEKITTCVYNNGMLDGPFTITRDNKTILECRYKDNKLHGSYVSNYDNGVQKYRAFYQYGMKQGEYKKWYETGRPKKFVSNCSNGIKNGIVVYYEDNVDNPISTKSEYRNGKLHGTRIRYFRLYSLVVEEIYECGLLKSTEKHSIYF